MKTIDEKAREYWESLTKPLADEQGLVETAYTCGALDQINNTQETFTLEQLITFGYYARKHPDTVMRQNYLDWKEQFESGKIPKAVLDGN